MAVNLMSINTNDSNVELSVNGVFEPSKSFQEIYYIPNVKLISVKIPLRLESVNKCEHWRKKAARTKKQAMIVSACIDPDLRLPVIIRLTRAAPRRLDDDLVGAFKGVRDSIARLFFPDTKRGQADSKDCFKWEYSQITSKEYAIFVDIIETN